MADPRLKNKQEQLEQALRGVMGKHQRQLLSAQLRHIDFLNQEIKALDQEIEQRMRPPRPFLGPLRFPQVGQLDLASARRSGRSGSGPKRPVLRGRAPAYSIWAASTARSSCTRTFSTPGREPM